MTQLLIGDQDPRPWSTGCARYEILPEREPYRLVAAVSCRFPDAQLSVRALLDTGAEWSVVGGEQARILRPDRPADGVPLKMQSRQGEIDGHLQRVRIEIPADVGRDLEVDATVLLDPKWEGPVVLGFQGFLERLRFALEPGHGLQTEPVWFFGQPG